MFQKPAEIPFFDKKDKIVEIATSRHVTVALTYPKGKVYFVGDKLARTIEIDNSQKFGFHELPVNDDDLYPLRKVVKKESKPEEKPEEIVLEVVKQPESKDSLVAMGLLNDDSEEMSAEVENEEEELLKAALLVSA